MLPELLRTVRVEQALSLQCACLSAGGIGGRYSSRGGLEPGDPLAGGKAEVLLRHFSLSVLQLRK